MINRRWTSFYLFLLLAALSDSYDDYNYDYHEEPQGWLCYACEYGIEYGEPAGSQECGLDFEPEDMPRNLCSDYCIVDLSKTNLESQDFMIHRGCSKHCQEVNNSTKKTQCCKSNLCNNSVFQAAISWADGSNSLPWLFISLLLFCHSLLRSRFHM